jgi:hypothetical protein
MRTQAFVDIESIRKFLVLVVSQYEKSAPTVASWANDLYVRLEDNLSSVRVIEILYAQSLLEDDNWEIPQYAANQIYKLMNDLGQDTTGHAGY